MHTHIPIHTHEHVHTEEHMHHTCKSTHSHTLTHNTQNTPVNTQTHTHAHSDPQTDVERQDTHLLCCEPLGAPGLHRDSAGVRPGRPPGTRSWFLLQLSCSRADAALVRRPAEANGSAHSAQDAWTEFTSEQKAQGAPWHRRPAGDLTQGLQDPRPPFEGEMAPLKGGGDTSGAPGEGRQVYGL